MYLLIFFVPGSKGPHYYDLSKKDGRVKAGWRYWSYTNPLPIQK